MREPQNGRMQSLPSKSGKRSQRLFGERAFGQFSRTAIGRIANKPMAHMGHMHPNLVSTPCLKTAFDEA